VDGCVESSDVVRETVYKSFGVKGLILCRFLFKRILHNGRAVREYYVGNEIQVICSNEHLMYAFRT
jgi:hypothetical protein